LRIDPYFLHHTAPSDTSLIVSARKVNEKKTHFVVNKIMSCVQTIAEPIIAVFGLSYKADVCDLRNSPSEIMIRLLKEKFCRIFVIKPHISSLPCE
jgi:UDP-N-acetyl-D-mannosaminuronic acid dehydrogenase